MPLRFAAVLIVLASMGTACGSSGDSPSSAPTGPPTSTTVVSTVAPATTAASTTAPSTTEPPPPTTAPSTTTPAPVPLGPTAFRDPGPFPVGVLTLTDRGVPLTVWYPGRAGAEVGRAPATYDMRALLPEPERAKLDGVDGTTFTMDAYTDLPAAPSDTGYPLVLFSHGLGGFAAQSSFLTTAIASWGFVVVAPEHTSRDLTALLSDRFGEGAGDDADLDQALAIAEDLSAAEDGPLSGIVDTTRTAVVGHSAGGGAAYRFARRRPDIATYVALASPASADDADPTADPTVSLLWVAGTADVIAPLPAVEAAWEQQVAVPKRLAVLDGVTHLGFMDVCTVAPERGGVLQVARDYGVTVPDLIVRLFADGCDPTFTAATDAWPVIRHLVVAHLRASVGIDAAPVGLDAALNDAYPVAVRWRSTE